MEFHLSSASRIDPEAAAPEGMDERGNDNESLTRRNEQLEHERDELRKDIEQLCLQQAGPSYLLVATRMHFQRTAGLEHEIENLKKKLALCTRENQNLQEELSEAYRIKSQLADLHSAEVSKNLEAEKQLKFFQGCVAAAFAERDHSLMESEKAKEREETISQKLSDCQNRVEELQSACLDEDKLSAALQTELRKLKEQNESFEKVISKFYEVRQRATGHTECRSWEEKCSCLLDDPSEMWTFDEDMKTLNSKYIVSLEEELERKRKSMDYLQNKMRVGLEIEQHLKRRVQQLEKKQLASDSMIREGLSTLRDLYSQQRLEVMNILEEENTQMKSMLVELQEKIKQLYMDRELTFGAVQRDGKCDDIECRDLHITSDFDSVVSKKNGLATESGASEGTPDTSNALAQALQEKVAALLLLSQQEERYLLERDVHVALKKKMEELQRNLIQVTNEKVKVLMELAQLKQEFQVLQENSSSGMRQGKILADAGDKNNAAQDRDGKLTNILKKTYLRRWISKDLSENETNFHSSYDESSPTNKKGSYSMDLARLKVENATLQESMANIEHLTSSIHKLRLSLLKARSAASVGPVGAMTEVLDNIILEANHVKTALGSSLPISWSAEAADAEPCNRNLEDPTGHLEASRNEKLDPVSAAGFEMVELLILAAEVYKEKVIAGSSSLHI